MRKRIFAAIEIPEDVRRRATMHIEFLRERFPQSRVSWDKPEKLHLTLKFFGEIEDEQIAKIIEAAQETIAKISPFEIWLAGTGVFPSLPKARVLWLGVEDKNQAFSLMHKTFEDACVKRGFEAEKRTFKPHLTIARLKEANLDLVKTHLSQAFESSVVKVSKMQILQSILQKEGSVFSLVKTV